MEANSSLGTRKEKKKRVRTWKPKVRTGCLTCRKRHVKCDEMKPICVNCSSKGYKCDGYESVSKRQDFEVSIPNWKLSSLPNAVPEDLRTFEFFCTYTSVELASTFGRDFWTKLVPNAALNEPVIYFGVMAVSSIHEHYSEKGIMTTDTTAISNDTRLLNAYRNYNQAIKCLLNANERTMPKDRILTACLLFTIFELVRGQQDTAMRHARSGLKVIGEYRGNSRQNSSPDSSDLISMSELEDRFLRFDLQARNDEDYKSSPSGCWMQSPTTFIPVRFSNLEEARNSLLYQMNFYLYHNGTDTQLNPSFRAGVPVKTDREVKTLHSFVLERANAWKMAFESWSESQDPQFKAFDQTSEILRVYYDYFLTLVEIRYAGSEMRYDNVVARFENMVERAEQIIQHLQSPSKCCKRYPVISVDIGLGEPMFCVAAKCRHPVIRRRALAVLEHWTQFEGVFNGKFAAQGARYIITLEEKGLANVSSADDIPIEARLIGLLGTEKIQDLNNMSMSNAAKSNKALIKWGSTQSCSKQEYMAAAERNARFNLLGCSRQ